MVIISGAYGKLKTWVRTQLHTDHQSASTESAAFKDVNIAVGEAYKQGAAIILRIKALNTFVGINAGKVTTGVRNNFMGYEAGYSNTTGERNNFMGYRAGYSNVGGNYNNFMGYAAGYSNISGSINNFMGYRAGDSNTTGERNNFMGASAGYSNVGGYKNNFMGADAGYSNVNGFKNNFMGYAAGYFNISGSYNIFIGYAAGYYETGNNKLFIDNRTRTNEADGRIKALIYGIFNASVANQLVRLNAVLELTSIKNGSTQVNAGAVANEVWKTNGHASLPDNMLMIGV